MAWRSISAVWVAMAVVAVWAVTAVGQVGPDSVHVTGELLDVEGHTTVPRGLLGLHADKRLTKAKADDWGVDGYRAIHYVPGSGTVLKGRKGDQMWLKDLAVVVDCQGDRFYPAVCLTNPNYEEYFARIGREYAENVKRLGHKAHAEFWNEPYLNWAERSRKNYDPKFYDVTKAVDDGPVTIKGWSEPLKHLRWRRLWAAQQVTDKKGAKKMRISYLTPVPEGAKVGDTFPFEHRLYFMPKGKQVYTVVEKWDVYDPTAVSFWSGKQNYDFYMWMFLPWAKAIRQANPDVQIIGGWDFAISADNYKAWELLYKPLIDEGIQYLDGISEHHYGSDTRRTAATYELVVGYAMAEHGKRLHCYNTETSGCVDPAVPGNRHGNSTPYGAYNYGMRDIIELVYRSPDKAVLRTAHGSETPGWGGGGDEFTFKMLKEFRGRLVHAASGDLNIWPAVALDGRKLVVVLYNDRPADRTISLRVDAPAGTTFAGCKRTDVVATRTQGPLKFVQSPIRATGKQFAATLKLTRKTSAKLTFNLTGTPAGKTQRVRKQFFAKGVLKDVTAGKPVRMQIKLPENLLARATQAWVKLAAEGISGGYAGVVVNGRRLALPDYDYITEVAVDPRTLRADNTLEFGLMASRPYKVLVASIVLDMPAKRGAAR